MVLRVPSLGWWASISSLEITMLNRSNAAGGMIPKLEACIEALHAVRAGHIIDGRVRGALLACVEGEDIGTRIV